MSDECSAPEAVDSTMPVFLQREGLTPSRQLLEQTRRPGLTRTTTVFGQEAWLVSRYEDVRLVLGDSELFTTGDSVPLFRNDDPDRADLPGAVLFMDPPEHTELRSMLAGSFTRRAVERLLPMVTSTVSAHLDAMLSAGPPVDLVQTFSWPIPSAVICELLGVPAEDRGGFAHDIEKSFDFTIAEDIRARANEALNDYMFDLVGKSLANPGDDLFGALIRNYRDQLTTKKLVGVGATLLQAGHETTAHMIASSVLTLLRHSDQLALLRAQPDLWPDAVEELLRYLAVVALIPPRRATRDTIVGEQAISGGELLLLTLPAANHDPAHFADPAKFDVTREGTGHLAFGHGIHRCIGAPLARSELAIALPALFERLPDIALAIDENDLVYKVGTVVHGVQALPVTW